LFLTSILIGDEFWASLSAEQQSVIQNAATVDATSERLESIKDIAKTEALCKDQGITINRLAENVRSEWANKTNYMYDKYSNMFSSNLLADIKAA
jgi:TRAP-type C4-dicarboxylate transport system substrate-binding protein